MNPTAAPASDLGLWLYVRCADRMLAVDAGCVERALLLEEAPPPDASPLGGGDPLPGCVGVLWVGGSSYGAWDLGEMLGISPARRAWILLRPDFEDGSVALALRTDECLHVGPPPAGPRLALPPAVVGRRAATRSVFAATRVPALPARPGVVGYELDLASLWSAEERRLTREMLSHG
jgi:hypothetical protein